MNVDQQVARAALNLELDSAAPTRLASTTDRYLDTCLSAYGRLSPQVREQVTGALMSMNGALKLPPPKWIIPGLIPERALCMIYGKEGTGKSFLTLDLLASVGTGTPFLGRTISMPGTTLYVTAEGVLALGNRLRAWLSHVDLPPDDTHGLFLYGGPVPLHTSAGLDQLRALIGKIGHIPQVIAFDTLAACSAGMDENDVQDVSAMLSTCQELIDAGSSVVLVHHANKRTGKGDPRGHTSMAAAAHTILNVSKTRGANVVTVTTYKQKDGEPQSPLQLTLEQTVLTTLGKVDGVYPSSCVLREATPDEIKEKVRVNPRVKRAEQARTALLDLVREKQGDEGLTTGEILRINATANKVPFKTTEKQWGRIRREHPKEVLYDPKTRKYRVTAQVPAEPREGEGETQ